jgi:large subunit ribosomal protein L9
MRVILLDDVPNLGEAGIILEVKNGYARNFLIPRKMAELATRDAVNRLELIKRAAETKRRRRMEEAAGKFADLGSRTLTIIMRAGSENRIFGAVTSQMIADEVFKQFSVVLERRHIMLEDPIKHLGDYIVPLRASAEVIGEIKLSVEPELKKGAKREPKKVAKEAAPAPAVSAEEPAPASVTEADDMVEAIEKYEHVQHEVDE